MVQSADNYLKEEQLYDYRLLSTLGFEEEDVEFFAGKEDVRAAEGAYFSDIIYIDTVGNEHVIKAHSLLSDINGMVVKAGRMPEAADECVVDSNLFGEDAIGDKIILSESNKRTIWTDLLIKSIPLPVLCMRPIIPSTKEVPHPLETVR